MIRRATCVVAACLVLLAPIPAVAQPVIPRAGECVTATLADDTAPARPTAFAQRLGLAGVRGIADGAGVTVAVIDTGVADHPRLGGVIPAGDFTGGGELADCAAHGTFVAGIIATRPGGDAIVGVAPAATIASVRQPTGDAGDLAVLADAIDAALAAGARILNVSLTSCAAPGATPPGADAVATAVDRAEVAGAVIVAAAGNAGGSCEKGMVAWPAVLDDVLAVTATGQPATPEQWAMTGDWVDVAAPGGPVVGPSPAGEGMADAHLTSAGATPVQGTSFAAPVVAGTAALVLSRHPGLSPAEVRRAITETAIPVAGSVGLGAGVVDPAAAVTWPERAAGADPRPVASPAAAVPEDTGPVRRLGLVAGVVVAAALAAAAVRALRGERS